MALIPAPCPLCGVEITTTETPLVTSGCAFDESHRLFQYCDTPMHERCLEKWRDREEFSSAYFQQRKDQYARERWLILTEGSTWFVGFIPPGSYPMQDPNDDQIEFRLKFWPIVMYGHASQWTAFLNGGWRDVCPPLFGRALADVTGAALQVKQSLPDTRTVLLRIERQQTLAKKGSDFNLQTLAKQYTGRTFGELVLLHRSNADLAATVGELQGLMEALPAPAREVVSKWLDFAAPLGTKESFWQQDSRAAFQILCERAESILSDYGVESTPAVQFDYFQIAVLNYVYTTYKHPQSLGFIKKALGIGVLGRLFGK